MTDPVAILRRTAALAVTLTLLAAPAATAQTAAPQAPASFLATPAFARVVEDKSLVVITTDGQRHEGHFTISGRALVLRGSAVTVAFEQVARVQKSTFRIRKHSLIGLGVGVGSAALIVAAECTEGCDGDALLWVLPTVFGGIGMGVGAGNGAILNARHADADIVFDTGLRFLTTSTSPSSSRLGTPAFAQLLEGKDVWITTADGAKRRGEVAVVTGNELILTGPQHASLPFDQIVTVVEVSHRIRNGMVNGLAAGMSLGLLHSFGTSCYETSDCGASFWGYTGLGVGAGALVGALMNKYKDRDLLYESRRKTTTLSFAPILSPTKRGMAFSMTWR
jgi:hypothetical protein